MFTRHGGVSPIPWASLNVGGTVGDDQIRVLENKHRAFAAIGREVDSIFDAWQVHSADVAIASAPRAGGVYQRADILITNSPDPTLFMRFADCVPLFLYDPVKRAIGLAHAGWLGTVRNAAGAAVRAMVEHFDCKPADILAGIGPSIGPDHYTVGENVVLQIQECFGELAEQHIVQKNGEVYFDLWSANRAQLVSEGICHIEEARICTACRNEDWYSHRAELGRTGRFGAIYALVRE